MAWNDATLLESNLKLALDTFNWPEAEKICKDVIRRINTEADLIPESTAKRLLQGLRRKRCFKLMTSLADAIMQSGLRTPQIRRQYAQALIDQDTLGAAEVVLQSIIRDSQGDTDEELEARGLMGRIYKQLYVNRHDPKSTRNRAILARALNEYLRVYELNPYQYLWHGINVVALADRARRDELPLVGRVDVVTLANEILTTLAERESTKPNRTLDAWDVATRVEAYVALGLNAKTEKGRQEYFKKAEWQALTYIASDDVDAFEIASTLRQFTEIWKLDDKTPPGDHLIPILNAGYLRKQGSEMELTQAKVEHEAASVADAAKDLEAMFGTEMVTLKWYEKGLEQSKSVARVERLDESGHGTGWLVNAADFFPGRQGLLLLTNAHVVSDNPNPFTNPLALYPSDVRINFQALGQLSRYEVEDEVVWTSPPPELDATFLALKGDPPAAPLTVHKKAVEMTVPPPRLYIMGHPKGGDLKISLQDNYLLACNERLLHYRTPTDHGSSGSPVFEPEFWRVVALHHKGSKKMPRMDNQPGEYEANEGIALEALKKATQNQTAPVVVVTHQRLNQAIMKAQPAAIMEAVKAPGAEESAGPPATDDEAAKVMEELSRALKILEAQEQVPGVLVSPDDMLTSVLQSLAEDSLKEGKVTPGLRSDLEAQFDEHDVIGWAKSLLTWVRGMKPHKWLNAPPTPDPLPNSLRAAVLGDWGSGLYGAPVCAASIQNDPKDYGLLLHLGDVYYSGTDREVTDRFLNLWPNKPKAISRACNANHEMYTGGYAYFDQILKQFKQAASYFALQNDNWLLVGLDTAYKEWEIVNEQVEWLNNLVANASNRRVVLFSHHQLFSWADKTQVKMQSQLGELLTKKKLFAWYWGHEHRCVIYDQHPVWGLFGRCIGHSGYPYFRDKFTEGATVENGPQNTSWRKVDAKNLVPGALILEGSNPYVPGHTEKYGPQGYLTLEFSGEHLKEIVQTPDGSVAYERQLS